jgi:hypothetical protein
MSGTDDSKRAAENSHSAPISPLLSEALRSHSPEIQQRVRDVISRKGK